MRRGGLSTEISNSSNNALPNPRMSSSVIKENLIHKTNNFYSRSPLHYEIIRFPKYYINNPSSLIETAVSSGGVEVIDKLNHTVRLSISPSQGDDPGFKSRPEHL